MEMSAKMAEAGLKPGAQNDPAQMSSMMEKMMEDPDMLKASMEMMSNMKDMDPEMLKRMAAQSGMSEEQLKQATDKMANVDPKTLQRLASVATYGFKAYKGAKSVWKWFGTRQGRIALACGVVGFAMWYAQPRPAAPAEQGDELGGYST